MVVLNKSLVSSLVITLFAVCSSPIASAFTTPRCSLVVSSVLHPIVTRQAHLLHESPSDQNETKNNSPANEQRPKKYSTARAGGRRAKKKDKIKLEREVKTTGLFQKVVVPIVMIALLFRVIFGSLFSGGSNVVYYSSTVYQTSTYSRDGKIETKTKESFQSNIPGLVERAKSISRENDGSSIRRGSYYDIDSIEDELLDVEDEINSIFGKW